mmetsp:Transcript_41594/g.93385  ORF Transcript_41594/g.93385 Transcript_41594/m.93385 type:complete len:434 (-) Transcript_41594:130-1431(-)
MASQADMGRSPTFVVGSNRQQNTLDALQRREQHFTEQYQKNKPLCFNAKAYQKTHPRKATKGQKDADATLVSPMLSAVADGVSQIEEFGIDASELPNQILNAVEELAVAQLTPDEVSRPSTAYRGPIALMREAYEATDAMGSTTVLLAVMDNSSKIHGKIHPMIAVLSIGDCELLVLRRTHGRSSPLEPIFHTEMQRIDGHAQSPLQVARVDETVDPEFTEDIAIEVIERGSAVHCVSAYEGDIVVMGSDGVFDNLFVDEIVKIVSDMLPKPGFGSKFEPADRHLLGRIARRVVEESHAKTSVGPFGYMPDAPIGKGGKVDDTSCVVAEVVEWTEAHSAAWAQVRRQKQWDNLFTCGGSIKPCTVGEEDEENELVGVNGKRNYPANPTGSFSEYGGSFARVGLDSFPAQRGYSNTRHRYRDDDDEDEAMCSIA